MVRVIEGRDDRIGLAVARAAFDGVNASAVYVADGTDVAGAIAASALAAAERSPLLIASGDLGHTLRQAANLANKLQAAEVVLVGAGSEPAVTEKAGAQVRVISRAQALAAYNQRVAGSRHAVVFAPSDVEGPFSPPRLSLGAIPYALGKGASLVMAGRGAGGGKSPEEAVVSQEARGLGPFHFVTIVGDHLALPAREMHDIDQVAAGHKAPRVHKIPSFVPEDGSAPDRAVGRLAALDAFDLSRWVVRMLHDASHPADGQGALVLANADEKFILGETISRTTSSELENAGVKVRSYYRDQITPELIRKELPGHALVLWEGHPRDLTLDDDALPAPEAPLPPATFFLQGCYTLDRADPYVLVERGANAVIGTYMAVYSASGSGFARAYLTSQLHAKTTAGEALASARSFLLAMVELKKRRGHADWRKTLRAALSFDLWGDPSAPLPLRTRPPAKPAPRAQVSGNRITVRIPARRLPSSKAGNYLAEVRPGAELSALYHHMPNGDRRLSELFFVELELPKAFGDRVELSGAIPETDYAWVVAPGSRKLYLLIHEAALESPAAKGGVLRFTMAAGPAQGPAVR
jgi:hypothetical protein